MLVALAGVGLLVVGVLALAGGEREPGAAPPATATPTPTPSASATSDEPTPTAGTGSAPATTAASSTVPATTTSAPPVPPRPEPTTVPARPRAPLTVLNNSTISGLADRAATEAQQRGWQIAQVGNFAGRLPATTVYYDPGDAAEEAAARQLAEEFPHVAQVLPRYAGLPPTPAGIVLVVTRDW
jgi:hypothetical protein